MYGQEIRTSGNSSNGGGEPFVCRNLRQVCRDTTVGSPVHADVASGPRIDIAAGISARIGVFETTVAVLLLIPNTARLGAKLVILWMTAIILSHIFVLGYGVFFVDALVLMLLAGSYLLLTRRESQWDEPKKLGTMAAVQPQKQ